MSSSHEETALAELLFPALPFSNLLTEEQFDEWCQRNHLPEYPSPDGSLQFDMLYRAENKDYDRYLRFYPDGTVLSASVKKGATPEHVAQWLQKGNKWSPQGRYKKLGAQIAFTTESSKADPQHVTVDYVGMVINDRAVYLESYSHYNGYRMFERYTCC